MQTVNGPMCRGCGQNEGGHQDGFCIECWCKCLEAKLVDAKMKLRDQAANAALTGLLARRAETLENLREGSTQEYSRLSYELADAMLAEREKSNEKV